MAFGLKFVELINKLSVIRTEVYYVITMLYYNAVTANKNVLRKNVLRGAQEGRKFLRQAKYFLS
jgi:hypothetical protein